MNLYTDCVIVGGGIAGLFLLARLRQSGYSVILLENQALGAGQTVASQGMIHGGMKYALQGFLSRSARNIAKMPETWRGFFETHSAFAFSKDCLLQDGQVLFSTGKLSSKIANFFGSKALMSRVNLLAPDSYPSILQNEHYEGSAYALKELVLNVPQVLTHFKKQYADSCIKISQRDLVLQRADSGLNSGSLKNITAILDDGQALTVHANQFYFTAGEGNARFLNLLPAIKMQKRPLHMVMVQSPHVSPLYGHAMMGGVNPEITFSSHQDSAGNWLWYMGGQLAESGIHRDEKAQAIETRNVLSRIFPWLDWQQAKVASFWVSRAEQAMLKGARPDGISFEHDHNMTIAWPTKLAFVPFLADTLLNEIQLIRQYDMPSHTFPAPEVARAPWQNHNIEWM